MTLAVLGLNHKSSRLELREILQRNIEKIHNANSQLCHSCQCHELVILSTCNRIEIYFSTDDVLFSVEQMGVILLKGHKNLMEEFRRSFYLFQEEDAVRHCFTVAPGLDSMILGEPEILGQVKQAYQTALEKKTLHGPLLRLFEKTFQAAKEIRTQTDIGKGAVGTASVSMTLAQNACGPLAAKQILILGGGQLGQKLIQHSIRCGCQKIVVSTRSPKHREELCSRYPVQVIPFSEWPNHLEKTDIFISAIAAPSILLTSEKLTHIMLNRGEKPLCLIDLAVPRSIDPAVSKIDRVHAFNIEDLKGIGCQNLKFREKAMAQAYAIIDQRARIFTKQLRSPNLSKMISELNQLVHECVYHEAWHTLEPYLLTEEERKVAEHAIYQLERNLSHHLVMKMKSLAQEEEIEDSSFLVSKLFQGEPIEFNFPTAFEKYPDHIHQDIKKRFRKKIPAINVRECSVGETPFSSAIHDLCGPRHI